MCKYNAEYLRKMLKELEKKLEAARNEEEYQLILNKIVGIRYVIEYYEDRIDHADKIEPSGFCIFHDPKAYKEKPEEVKEEFLKWLKNREASSTKEIVAVGFNLPNIDLSEHKFRKPVIFALTKFKGKSTFSHVEFEYADFSYAEFENILFHDVKFKKAYFIGTEFKTAYFVSTKFKEARFFFTTFGETEFWLTEFENVNFLETEFKGLSIFKYVEFKEVDFRYAKFRETCFYRVRFRGRACFDYAYVDGLLIFYELFLSCMFNTCRTNSYVSLRNIKFGDKAKIVIDGCFIDRFSFINTDLFPNRIMIKNPKYSFEGDEILLVDKLLFLAKIKYRKYGKLFKEYLEQRKLIVKFKGLRKNLQQLKIMWIKFRIILRRAGKIPLNELIYAKNLTNECRKLRNEFFKDSRTKRVSSFFDLKPEEEEYILRKMDELVRDSELTVDNVLRVYRDLRDHFDYMLRYGDSGKLFVGEMRLRESMADWREKIFFKIYDLLAVYGENAWRPVIVSVVTILLFSLLLNWDYVDPVNVIWHCIEAVFHGDWPALQKAFASLTSALAHLKLRESLLTFFQLRDIEECGWFSLIERLIAIPIFGSLVIALRRKLERRIRH